MMGDAGGMTGRVGHGSHDVYRGLRSNRLSGLGVTMRFSNNAASLSKPTGLGFLPGQLTDSKSVLTAPPPSVTADAGDARCHGVGEEAVRPQHRWGRRRLRWTVAPRGRAWFGLPLALLVVCSGVTRSATAAGGERPADGLRLTYEVSFGSIPVGRSYYSWVPDGEATVWVSKELAPSGPMARLYRVRDRFVARVHLDGRPELLYEDIDEPKGRRQERWSAVHWDRGQTTFVRVDHTEGKTDREVVSSPPGMQWPLTLPYWIAHQPVVALDGLAVPLLDGTKLKEVRLRVLGEESVKTDLGPLACDRIDGEVWYRGERQRAGSFQAWRRRTAPHIPVRIISRLKFGTLKETLFREAAYGVRPEIPPPPIDTRDRQN